MKIKRIKLKNIRSYENQEVSFPDGSVLLAGDIGSGKTSILLAIEYGLFGLQPGQTGSSLLRNNSSLGEVVLELEIQDKQVIIERRLKRGKSITNDYSSISINGNKVECSVTELKNKVLQLLNYPSEFLKKNNLLYRYTVYTPQEQMKQIILEDPEARLNILRHIFGIDKYKTIRENLSILLNKFKEELKLLQLEIRDIDSDKARILELSSSIVLLEKEMSEKDQNLLSLVQKRKSIELVLQELEKKIKEKNELETEQQKAKVRIESKQEVLRSLKKEIKEMESSLSEIHQSFKEEDLLSTQALLEAANKELNKLDPVANELSGKLSSFKQKREENLNRKDRISSLHLCHTCMQVVPAEHKHHIINAIDNEISSISKDISESEQSLSSLVKDIENFRSVKYSLEEKKIQLEIKKGKYLGAEKDEKKLSEMQKLNENTEKDIDFLIKHFNKLKEDSFNLSRYDNLYRIKQEELKQFFKSEKGAEIFIAGIKKEAELMRRSLSDMSKIISAKEETRKKMTGLQELNDWLSNQFLNLIDYTERSVMLKLRGEFSKLFSKWFNILAGESFSVQLDESFTPLIMNHDVEMDYSSISGGERTSVALAYRLALNQIINSMLSSIQTRDIVILDEPTEGFSEKQIGRIREIFKELKAKQLIIVSHEQKIEGFVDNIIYLRKDSNQTILEYQKT